MFLRKYLNCEQKKFLTSPWKNIKQRTVAHQIKKLKQKKVKIIKIFYIKQKFEYNKIMSLVLV